MVARLACLLVFAPALMWCQAPRIFYTDLVSGPAAGGQNNNGAFITLYGKRFGPTQGSGSVTVGGGSVAGYPVWTDTKVTIQLGASAATGNIVVTNSNGVSNGIPFAVAPGNIYFVAVNGSDGGSGSYSSPWRTLTYARDTIAPGDIVYAMNGVAQTTDDGQGWNSCLTIGANSGAPGALKAMVVYPGATATIGNVNSNANGGCDTGVRTKGQGESYWAFAGFTIRGGTTVMQPYGETGWRIVGNDMSCPNGNNQSGCLDLAYEVSVSVYGNNIHHVGTNLKPGAVTALYHGVYISEINHGVDFGWNTIAYVQGCRGLQQNVNEGSSSYDLHIHDNVIHDTQCDGIVMTTVDPSKGTVELYNNIIYNAGTGPANFENTGVWSCMTIEGYDPSGYSGSGVIEVYNNTMYDCGNWTNPPYGGSEGIILWSNEGNPKKSLRLRNNILYASTVSPYCDDLVCGGVAGSNNIFFGNGAPPANANIAGSINADPKLTSLALSGPDFHLEPGSPAIGAGVAIPGLTTDFDGVARSALSIGAYEYVTSGGPTMIISVTPSSLAFGSVVVNQTSTLMVTITNVGSQSVAITGASVTGAGFSSVSQPLYPTLLPPNFNLQYTVKFAPTVIGTASGVFSVASNATNSPNVSLSGTGASPVGIAIPLPTLLDFGDVAVGQSATLTTTITNAGNENVTITGASIPGSDFTIVRQPSYPDVLPPNGTAQYTIKFAPTSMAAEMGTLSITSNATPQLTEVFLLGIGFIATKTLAASPASVKFGSVALDQSSTQTATITNTGTTSVTIRSASISVRGPIISRQRERGFSIVAQPSYPYVLAPKATVNYTVKLAPSAMGAVSSILTVASDATNSPIDIALSGTGVPAGSITVGKKGSNGSGSTSTTSALTVGWNGGGSTAGSDTVIVIVYANNGPYSSGNISDSAGNIYHLDATMPHPHFGVVYVFSCLNAAPASSVTVTPPSFGIFEIAAFEYHGLLPSGALDKVGALHDDGFQASSGMYSWATNSVGALMQPTELALVILAEAYGNVTSYSGIGYTQEILQGGYLGVMDAVQSATSPLAPSGTYTANAGTWVGSFVMTYK